jgi:hypothetical protein
LELELHAYDEDVIVDEWLGSTEPELYSNYVFDTLENVHEVNLLDKKFKKVGNLKYSTKFIYVPPAVPTVSNDNINAMWKGCSTMCTSYQTEGMKTSF